jgi:hypothetical protein
MSPIPGIVASQISGHLASPSSYESIATVTISSDTNTISFSSIPSTYTHLQLRGIVRCNYNSSSTGASAYKIQFNGDTGANYSFHAFQGNGTTASANSTSSTNQILGVAPWGNAGGFGAGLLLIPFIMDIVDYQNTNKTKTVKIYDGFNTNTTSTNQYLGLRSGAWYNTGAINSILLDATAGSWSDGPFAANTSFALYGIRG